ncbi:MAG: transcription elongation factor GreA [Phycisphaerales bacterium]|nr:transcription elongation factor GreA [Phycisphaerales bacterium]
MNILTAEEKSRLERELIERAALRKQISERIAEARALGDLKENAEYHAAREDQGMNEAKIRDLESKLATAQVADQSAIPEDMVFIGATVRLRDVESGDEDLYRLVGQASGDFSADYVEVTTNSPMGMALMKSKVGETVRVTLPRGERQFLILELVV